jgi:hypothetical protein
VRAMPHKNLIAAKSCAMKYFLDFLTILLVSYAILARTFIKEKSTNARRYKLMKKYLNSVIYILCFVLIGATMVLYNPEVCKAKEFDASLNVMGYDRNVTIYINGVHISRITGGRSQSVRLFLADDPKIKTLSPEMQKNMKELFCLKIGENTIEILFSEKGQPKAPGMFTVSIDSGNYNVSVLTYTKNPDVKKGKAKGIFKIYNDEPAGFKTIILQ